MIIALRATRARGIIVKYSLFFDPLLFRYFERDPFSQNSRAEIRKFLGVELVRKGAEGRIVLFYSTRKTSFRAH